MKTIIISLGGSIIVPKHIDHVFLRKFKKLIEEFIKKDCRFIIITGGGYTARKHQKAASKICELHPDDLDWIGIHATRINAHLLRTIFKKDAYPKIIKDPNKKITTNKKIIIAAGWKPGRSTDYVAVLLAKNFSCSEIINLSNIEYVYNKDPRKFKDAKPLINISWKEFRKIVGDKWDPGLNMPFDPVASKEAQSLRLKVAIMRGKDVNNLRNHIEGKEFRGTIIQA
jgi:uridylate kinase